MVRLRNSDLKQKPKPHTSAAVYSRAFGGRPDVTLNLVEEMHCYKADGVFFLSPSSPCPLTLCRKSHSSLVSLLQNFQASFESSSGPEPRYPGGAQVSTLYLVESILLPEVVPGGHWTNLQAKAAGWSHSRWTGRTPCCAVSPAQHHPARLLKFGLSGWKPAFWEGNPRADVITCKTWTRV